MSDIPFIIINPQARSGKIGKKLEEIKKKFKQYLGEFEYELTQGPLDEIRIATEAIEKGFKKILVCGGDGTATNTGDAIINSGNKDVVLGLISAGSMCDWHKTHSIPFNMDESLQIIAEGHYESFPAMKCIGDKTYYSFDMADGGFTGAAAAAAHHEVKWIKNGDIKYLWLALKYVLVSKNTKAKITIDDREPIEINDFTNLIVAFGDEIVGFKVLPGNDYFSRVNKDLGVFVLHKLKGFRRIIMLIRALSAKHVGKKGVWLTRGRKVVIETERPIPWEAEGEIFNEKSHTVTIEYVEDALKLFVPKNRTYNDKIDENIYNEPFENSFKKRKVEIYKK
ncbi:MAG: hypothetical protein K9W45_04700 [Candidatus Heimdallarchaeum aukensis]|uniref:DAGKc domain-containing protein n=1 Tax=Candidatus Heimdallarchaeum aukensis TaxID=2876573 RepID=A0A9Y1BMX9_9ARCH|nr:MAG: hypothetical protein K9W45_04700 [Candidatus Heimdallarchaeum aukensis]